MMPSSSRRFLAAAGTADFVGAAGCIALRGRRPDVDSATGLTQDTSHALEDETVYLAGEGSDLPTPSTTTESLDDATAVLATATAEQEQLEQGFRAGKPVAIAGNGATAALRRLLDSARPDYTAGLEMMRARPVSLIVADPRGDTVETYTFVAEGGWDDPILGPFGWALVGRIPECDTFVPESSMDDLFEYAGATHLVGRLPTGEAYVSRSEASISQKDAGRFVRLQMKLHATANDGYGIEQAVRESDLPDDQHLDDVYPNPHTQNGVQIANHSDTTRSTSAIKITPDSSRARSALTGCGGFRTEGTLAYDFRTSVRWKREGFLDSDRRYGNATGRGEWSLNV